MFILLLSALLSAVPAQNISAVTLTPSVTGEIDLGRLKGTRLAQLAWSPDATELYLQTYTPDRQALPAETFHYVLSASDLLPKQVAAPPDWAASYWTWKSAQAAPDDPAFKIELETQKGMSAATSLPMGGEMARGGGDTGGAAGASMEGMLEAARQSQTGITYRMRLKGEVVGEWVNHRIMPGLTFGWAPAGTGWIAYAEKSSGKLILMDKDGRKKKIDGTKNVMLPAWTADGARLAYLESRGRNKYAVIIAAVGR
jgi:hypothetical protein